MPTRPDDQAFPIAGFVYGDGSVETPNSGMTIREHMATQIMAGLTTNYGIGPDSTDAPAVASKAVIWADALIAALNTPVGAAPKGGDGG